MIPTGMSNRWLRETQRLRREREQREHLQQLQVRWRIFALPIQEELALHLRRFGLESAQHATAIAERLLTALMDTRQTTDPP